MSRAQRIFQRGRDFERRALRCAEAEMAEEDLVNMEVLLRYRGIRTLCGGIARPNRAGGAALQGTTTLQAFRHLPKLQSKRS